MQITKEDFDKAVKQPFSVNTCIVAQAALREFGKPLYRPRPDEDGYDTGGSLEFVPYLAAQNKVMRVFDKHFRNPGDENKPELQALRASLQITI